MSTLNVDTIQDKGAAFEHARLVQVVNTTSSAVASGSTTMPNDDTIPTSSEGNALTAIDTAITPTNTGNNLLVQVNLPLLEITSANHICVALFRDSGSAAIAAATNYTAGSTAGQSITINHFITGSLGTSETTFKVRFGAAASMVSTVNGYNGSRIFGGVSQASITISEYRA